MKKIPCRKCSCGTYHDITVTTCRCGKDISEADVEMVDVDGLSEEEYGEIDRNLIIYAQRCRRCGAFTFTTDPEKPLTNCSGCKSRTIAGVKPVLYVDKDEKAKNEENPVNEESPERTATAEKTSAPEEDEEEEIVDWGGIVGGLEEVLHKTTGEFEAKQSLHRRLRHLLRTSH